MEKLFPWAAGPAGLATRLLLGPFALAVVTLLRAGIFHLCLLVVGGAGRGFQITLGVVAYATAADRLALLPLCGGLAGVIYGLILTAIGLAHAHRISGGKAATAVLLPVMLACCGCAALLILFGGSVVSLLQGLD